MVSTLDTYYLLIHILTGDWVILPLLEFQFPLAAFNGSGSALDSIGRRLEQQFYHTNIGRFLLLPLKAEKV
jgi:hypothetical protein